MKKMIFIAVIAGLMIGSTAPIKATATPVTMALGAASAGTLFVGSVGWALGHFGLANTVGTAIAGAVGGIAGYATDSVIGALISHGYNLGFIAENPLVLPLGIGAVVTALMFFLRDSYLSSKNVELEKLSTTIMQAGIGLGAIATLAYLYNASGYKVHFAIEKATTEAPKTQSLLSHICKSWN